MTKLRFQCPGCGTALAGGHLPPNAVIDCPKCGRRFLPVAAGLPANGPSPRALPVARPAPAPAPSAASGVNVCLVGLVMLLLGMVLSAGAVYWVINPRNEVEPVKVVERDAAGDTSRQPEAPSRPPDRPTGTEPAAPQKGPPPEPKPDDGSRPAPPEPKRPPPPAEERKPDPPPAPLVPQAPAANVPAPGPAGPFAPKEVGPDVVSVGDLDGGVQSLAFAPDGKRLAAYASDQVVKLFNLDTRQVLELGKPVGLGKPAVTAGVAFTPDGKLLAAAAGRTVTLYDLDGKEVKQLDQGDFVLCVATSPQASVLATAAGTKITLWDTATWARKQELDTGAEVPCVAVTPDGTRVFAATKDTLFVWDAATGQKRFERPLPDDQHQSHPRAVSMAFAPDGKVLVLARGSVSDPLLVEPASATVLRLQEFWVAFRFVNVWAVAFAPNGLLAVAGKGDPEESRLTLWDLNGKREVARRFLPAGTYPGLAFAPDGKTLAYGGDTKAVQLWSLSNTVSPPRPVATLMQGEEVRAVAFSPDSRVLAVAGMESGPPDYDDKGTGMLKLWDTRTFTSVSIVEHSPPQVKLFKDVAFTADGKTLAAAGGVEGRTVHFWDLAARKPLPAWTGPSEFVLPSSTYYFYPSKLAFSPDGGLWAAAAGGGSYSGVLVVERGKEKTPLKIKYAGRATALAFSPDKTLVAVFDGSNVVPYATTSGEAQTPLLPKGGAFAMAHSPDSAKLAVAMSRQEERTVVVKIFDFASGKEEKQVTAPWAAETQSLTSNDSRSSAWEVALNDKSVAVAVMEYQGPRAMLSLKVWDLATGKLRRSVLTEAELWLHVTSLALSPDNKLLAVGSYYFEKRGVSHYTGRVTLWKVED